MVFFWGQRLAIFWVPPRQDTGLELPEDPSRRIPSPICAWGHYVICTWANLPRASAGEEASCGRGCVVKETGFLLDCFFPAFIPLALLLVAETRQKRGTRDRSGSPPEPTHWERPLEQQHPEEPTGAHWSPPESPPRCAGQPGSARRRRQREPALLGAAGPCSVSLLACEALLGPASGRSALLLQGMGPSFLPLPPWPLPQRLPLLTLAGDGGDAGCCLMPSDCCLGKKKKKKKRAHPQTPKQTTSAISVCLRRLALLHHLDNLPFHYSPRFSSLPWRPLASPLPLPSPPACMPRCPSRHSSRHISAACIGFPKVSLICSTTIILSPPGLQLCISHLPSPFLIHFLFSLFLVSVSLFLLSSSHPKPPSPLRTTRSHSRLPFSKPIV